MVDGNWKTFMARATVLSTMFGIVVFGAVKLAVADPGGPVTPDELTYAGVVLNAAGTAPVTGPVELSFTMRRADGAVCGPVSSRTTASSTGAFTARVETTGCSRGFFNGATIHYDVSLVNPAREAGPLTPDGGIPITPVPYARFADQAGVNNDCPAGYSRNTSDAMIAPSMRLCTKMVSGIRDDVVRVGTGATAFWIDRYEATIWNATGDRQFNVRVATDVEMLGLLPPNGEWRGQDPPLFARSQTGRDLPARWVTWFQAEALCRASGKRLPTGSEWLAAARGTGGSSGETGCHIGAGTEPREISGGSECVSDWGARDMVGNVWEWTAEWYAGLVLNGGNYGRNDWPTGYGGDRTWNITMSVQNAQGSMANFAIPAAALRGGSWGLDSQAGRFALLLAYGPSYKDNNVGFRCVIPR